MRAPGLGSVGIARTLDQTGDLDSLFSSKSRFHQALKAQTRTYLNRPDSRLLDSDLAWLEHPNHHLVTLEHPDYPALLKKIPGHPAALFIDGDPLVLWQPQLAVVGSRNPTQGGRDNARSFAEHLAAGGLVIVSGLADGIDTEAHRAALRAGGHTVAVLGTGVDRVYPARNRDLAERIAARGALVSEFPLGTAARPSHFPARNRIISGLSLGTLVIEAGLKSGSLITARHATEQGREVFAVPGSIHNPMAKGCHRLIRQGAKLTEKAEDIINELQPLARELASAVSSEINYKDEAPEPVEERSNIPNIALDHDTESPVTGDPEYRQLWSKLSFDPQPVDRIIEQSGLEADAVSSMLLMLELRGMVEAHRGGAYSRKQ